MDVVIISTFNAQLSFDVYCSASLQHTEDMTQRLTGPNPSNNSYIWFKSSH